MNILIPKVKHLEDKSCYNHNYYEIIEQQTEYFYCDDKCKILYEECDENYDVYMYHFGYFDENDNFYSMIAIESNEEWNLK